MTHEHFLKHHLQIAAMYAGPCLCASGNWILPCLKIALCNPAQPKVQGTEQLRSSCGVDSTYSHSLSLPHTYTNTAAIAKYVYVQSV